MRILKAITLNEVIIGEWRREGRVGWVLRVASISDVSTVGGTSKETDKGQTEGQEEADWESGMYN